MLVKVTAHFRSQGLDGMLSTAASRVLSLVRALVETSVTSIVKNEVSPFKAGGVEMGEVGAVRTKDKVHLTRQVSMSKKSSMTLLSTRVAWDLFE